MRLAVPLLLVARVAAAHPIEPILTGSPMPVPRDWIAADLGYSALHSRAGFDQDVPVTLSAGIGGMAEIFVGGGLDATDHTVAPIFVGGKVLLLMEGRGGLDLAIQGAFNSDESADGELLLGRSILPGFYLQAAIGVAGASGPTVAVATHSLNAQPRHESALPTSGNAVDLHAAAALQWAVRPNLLPTVEAQVIRLFADLGNRTDTVVAPEIIWLLEINHLSVKLAVPVGLTGQNDIGFLTSLDWQR